MTTSGESFTESRPAGVVELEDQLLAIDLSELKRIDLLAELAWELRHLDTNRALDLSGQVFELATELDYQKGLASGLLARGFVRSRLGECEKAKEDAEKSYALFEGLGDGTGSYRALNLLGVSHGQLGNLSDALRTFLETHMLCEMLGDIHGAATALNNAALVHTHLSDYPSALELFSRALKLYKDLEDSQGTVMTLANIASVYNELSRFEDAISNFEQALTLHEKWRDPKLYAHILFNLADNQIELGQLDKAVENILESKTLAEARGDKQVISSNLVCLGAIFVKQGRVKEAQDSFSKALAISCETGDRLSEIKIHLELATLLIDQNRIREALELLRPTLSMAEVVNSRAELYRTHLLLATAFDVSESYQEAFLHYKTYSELKDEVFNNASDQKLQSLRVSFQVEQAEREREIYRLKNAELAQANEKLNALNGSLQDLNEQKTSLLSQLERQALEDALTGLSNRRHFDNQISILFANAQATGQPLSFMICDIDNFKRINDSFSHQMGDEVLMKVAELFQQSVRKSDVLARYGGEEFVLAMPDTSRDVAVQVCERLREAIEFYAWQDLNADLRVTVSLGLAYELIQGGFEKMIAIADDKLYEAKQLGKNTLCY